HIESPLHGRGSAYPTQRTPTRLSVRTDPNNPALRRSPQKYGANALVAGEQICVSVSRTNLGEAEYRTVPHPQPCLYSRPKPETTSSKLLGHLSNWCRWHNFAATTPV